MKKHALPRLDVDADIRRQLLPHCRLEPGDVWEDPNGKHRIACLDATNASHVTMLMGDFKATVAIQDPPYNLVAFEERSVEQYIQWCGQWVQSTSSSLAENASFYIWLGADQTCDFQPLPDFMMMMRQFKQFQARSFVTMRNQRGYGTQKNWMAVRQELLYYTKGNPYFQVQYTDIPKILRGYYKEVAGTITENLQRSRSQNIRASNVWVDVQQVFYRMQENVSGCYAQKPVKAIERIILASSRPKDIVIDFFAHSGTTLLSAERLNRRCLTMDIDPVFCEIAIRRLEHYRRTGRLGWQGGHAFEDVAEIDRSLVKTLPEQKVEMSQGTLF